MTDSRDFTSRNTTINIHLSELELTIIDRAAATLGKSRAEFMVESALHAAEDILLDRTLFVADDAAYKQFMELLDVFPPSTGALSTLLRTPAPWE